MLVKILNFFKGYISVKANGGFNERLINLCSLRGIPIWNISYVDKEIFFFTKPKYYRILKQVAADSGVDIRVHGRFGLPFLISKNRERLALLIGLIFILVFTAFMSTRIWSVCVTGNDGVFDSEITEAFEKLGVKVGTRKKDIDIIAVQNEFLSKFEDRIIWVSLNLEGMCAEIQVREAVKSREISNGEPCNIVAAFDGTIKSMRVYSGTQVESVKNGVKQGDLLISGIVEYYDGALDFVEARGDIAAEHTVKVKSETKDVKIRRYLHSKEYYALSAFSLTFPFGKKVNDESTELTLTERESELNNVTLPFSYTKYVQSFYEICEANKDIKRKYLLAKYLNEVSETTKNSDVISVKSKFSSQGENLKLTGEINCVDYIGKSVPISLKNE